MASTRACHVSDIVSFVTKLDLDKEIEAKVVSSLQKEIPGASATSLNLLSNNACKLAALLLPAELPKPGPVFQSLFQENWSKACWLQPSCIISPKCPKDVSLALRVIDFFQIPFAVRSGRHSPNPGFSSLHQPGVLIQLSSLNAIILNEDKSVVSIGPGNRWGEVYRVLAGTGITVPGGRVSTVGVGGLVLGGGFSLFTNEYGFTCDNAKNFEVVLANGMIVNANTEEHSDLFWALKGGSSNFGIVTRIDFFTILVDKIYHEAIITAPEDADRIFDALLSGTTAGMMLAFTYSEPAEERPAEFRAFDDIPATQTLAPPTNGTQGDLLDPCDQLGLSAPGRWLDMPSDDQTKLRQNASIPSSHLELRVLGTCVHDYRGASSQIDVQLYKDVHKFFVTEATRIFNATGANMTFTIQTVSESALRRREQTGGNAMGYQPFPQQWFNMVIDWKNEADDVEVRNVGINVTNKWAELAEQRGLGIDFLYLNDASRDQKPLATAQRT